MADIKWADVAHMYLNSGIQSANGNYLVECREGENLWQSLDTDAQDLPFELPSHDQPILSHYWDITEAQAREIYLVSYGHELPDDFPNVTNFVVEMIKTTSKKMVFFIPMILWLISNGFDLFNLIESGQSIRKGVENG
jgi:hypothetical protein